MNNPMLPGPQPVQAVIPLQWQLAYGVAANGSRICMLQLMQGSLNVQIHISPEDADKLGHGILDTATQARTGLIIPNSVTVPAPLNGNQGNH